MGLEAIKEKSAAVIADEISRQKNMTAFANNGTTDNPQRLGQRREVLHHPILDVVRREISGQMKGFAFGDDKALEDMVPEMGGKPVRAMVSMCVQGGPKEARLTLN